MKIRPFTAPDEVGVRQLLTAADLPQEDLDANNLAEFLVAHTDDGVLAGAVGLERYDTVGLLRSLVVLPSTRGAGVGNALVLAMEQQARASGVNTFYLLTTTAADFFLKLGYRIIARTDAPPAMASTQEFSSLCPDTAVCMTKRIG